MTTILAVYNGQRCIGTCDSRCYNGMQPSQLKEPRRNACCCICGGANHGMGFTHAMQNTVSRAVGLTPEALKAFAEARGINPDDLMVVDRLRVRNPDKALALAKATLVPVPLTSEDLFFCDDVAGSVP